MLFKITQKLYIQKYIFGIVSIIEKEIPKLLDVDHCLLFIFDQSKSPPKLIFANKLSFEQKYQDNYELGDKSNVTSLRVTEICAPLKQKNQVSKRKHEVSHIDIEIENTYFQDKETILRDQMICCPMLDKDNNDIGYVIVSKNIKSMLEDSISVFKKNNDFFLKHITAHIAVAVLNVWKCRQQKEALKGRDVLLKMTQQFSKSIKNESEYIQLIVSQAQQLLGSERCTVFLLNKDKTQLYTNETMSFGMGAPLPIDRTRGGIAFFSIDKGIVGSVATTGETINISDAYQDLRFSNKMDLETGFQTRSILCMPIRIVNEEILGVIQLINKKNREMFDHEDEILLQNFSTQVSIVIRNSKLFKKSERALGVSCAKLKQLQIMRDVAKNLFTEMQLTNMVDRLFLKVKNFLHTDTCRFYVVDNQKNFFYIYDGLNKKYPKKLLFNNGVAGRVAATGKSVLISTYAYKDPRFDEEVDQVNDTLIMSIVSCAIKKSDAIIGVISCFGNQESREFTDADKTLLLSICEQESHIISKTDWLNDIMSQSSVKGNISGVYSDKSSNSSHQSENSAMSYLTSLGMHFPKEKECKLYRMSQIQIIGSVGAGSFGEVFRGKIEGLPEIVAIKKFHVRISPDEISALCNKCSLICQLEHPNIVRYIGAIVEPNNMCIIIEFCDRGSLASILSNVDIKMDWKTKINFLLEAAYGIYYLHTYNPPIIHRNLKVGNLMVDKQGRVKLGDFGCSLALSRNKIMDDAGIARYTAPEVIQSLAYSEKSDVFAFAIIMWEILLRKIAFQGMKPLEISLGVQNNLRPIVPKELQDDPLVSIMKNCWDHEPTQRPSFNVIIEELTRMYAT